MHNRFRCGRTGAFHCLWQGLCHLAEGDACEGSGGSSWGLGAFSPPTHAKNRNTSKQFTVHGVSFRVQNRRTKGHFGAQMFFQNWNGKCVWRYLFLIHLVWIKKSDLFHVISQSRSCYVKIMWSSPGPRLSPGPLDQASWRLIQGIEK